MTQREQRSWTRLEDRHSKGIYVRALRRQLSLGMFYVPISFRIYYLWSHPPNRASRFVVTRSFNRTCLSGYREPKIRQQGSAFGVDEDVCLDVTGDHWSIWFCTVTKMTTHPFDVTVDEFALE